MEPKLPDLNVMQGDLTEALEGSKDLREHLGHIVDEDERNKFAMRISVLLHDVYMRGYQRGIEAE